MTRPVHLPKVQGFFHQASPSSLEPFSLTARVKARVSFTRSADDDGMQVLEILAVAPF